MLNKISSAEAGRNFSGIIERVISEKEAVILTKEGREVAAVISIEDMRLLREIEDRIDIEDAWRARSEPGEDIPWEKLREELYLVTRPGKSAHSRPVVP